mgnify:FL=1
MHATHHTRLRRILLSVWAMLLTEACLTAGELSVPQSYPSIQFAINAAKSGDVVLVTPGIYRERLKLKEGITVRSTGDDAKGKLGLKRAEATIIDGGSANDLAGVIMSEGSVLDGFTVTNVGTYDDAEWQKHHATQGNDQPHEHIGAPGVAGISITGVTCVVTNNIVHHIGYTPRMCSKVICEKCHKPTWDG